MYSLKPTSRGISENSADHRGVVITYYNAKWSRNNIEVNNIKSEKWIKRLLNIEVNIIKSRKWIKRLLNIEVNIIK